MDENMAQGTLTKAGCDQAIFCTCIVMCVSVKKTVFKELNLINE